MSAAEVDSPLDIIPDLKIGGTTADQVIDDIADDLKELSVDQFGAKCCITGSERSS